MYKEEITAQQERQRKEEEESRPVGPAPPPMARVDDPSGYGINLRPGEGERCVIAAQCSMASVLLTALWCVLARSAQCSAACQYDAHLCNAMHIQ